MAMSLTEDLLSEILVRIPLKSLLQCKSVSKSWLSIISSHRFAKSHLHRAITSTVNDETLIVHLNRYNYGPGSGLFSVLHVGSGQYVANLDFPYSQGEYPFKPKCLLIGSDYGIVCVDVSDWLAAKNKTDIYLWNPATKHSKLIPRHTMLDYEYYTIFDYQSKVVLGFVFDPIDFDFKVVRVVPWTLCAEVYSTNRNAWRNIEIKPTDCPYRSVFDVCLHGFLFGTGYRGMIAFDPNKEVFICNINLPVTNNFDQVGRSFDARISDFKGSVAVSMYKQFNAKINLWTLDDEACLRGGGVHASWTMMLSIDVGEGVIIVEGLFNSAEFLLGDVEGNRFLYNSDKKVARDVPEPPFMENYEVFKYTESLFSVAGSKRVKWTAVSSRLQDESDSDVEMDG